MPYAIFGAMSILQVVTVTLLPETLGNTMLTSIDEAETFYRDTMAAKANREIRKFSHAIEKKFSTAVH